MVQWYGELIKKLFLQDNTVSKGIPLQICDVFLQELNKVDAQEISNNDLSSILEPFLHSLGHCENKILIERIIEKLFTPLLENNVTTEKEESEESEEEEINYDPKKGKWVDGGKMNPKVQKEIRKMLDFRFVFPNFNILLYCSEQIFKMASDLDTREENRDAIYHLYEKILKIEPKGEPELTFSQRMLVNRAKAFMTKRMERRDRVKQDKRSKKLMHKLGNIISNQIIAKSDIVTGSAD